MSGLTTTTTWPSGRTYALTASDRHPTWHMVLQVYKAVNRARVGDAKFKYFQHAGCLMTADGTDDDLIKLEGAPPGYKVVVPS